MENKQATTENTTTKERTKCERYSRVVGYIRPLQQWNVGKEAEWSDRKMFNIMNNLNVASRRVEVKNDNQGLTEVNLN